MLILFRCRVIDVLRRDAICHDAAENAQRDAEYARGGAAEVRVVQRGGKMGRDR